jgi:uncharacterized protein YggU (UPF0235/DUF167 family)
MKLKIRLTPNAKQNTLRKEIDLLSQEEIRCIRLTAKPVDGEANKALIAFLAKELSCPKRYITLVSGHTSRWKIVHIEEI